MFFQMGLCRFGSAGETLNGKFYRKPDPFPENLLLEHESFGILF